MVDIVAEISGNHGGSLEKAKELIDWAAWAGCDFAKFQFYRPEDMPDRIDNEEMYRKLMIPDEWLPDLFDTARINHIGLFASVFSVRAVETLLKFDTPFIKIASPESTRLPMETYWAIVEAIPADVKLIVSYGAATCSEMKEIKGSKGWGLYCPPGHPPRITDGDLRFFKTCGFRGLSDHTSGIRVPLAFIRAGAMMIEKHLKMDDDCVDAAFSADLQTMRQLCGLAHR